MDVPEGKDYGSFTLPASPQSDIFYPELRVHCPTTRRTYTFEEYKKTWIKSSNKTVKKQWGLLGGPAESTMAGLTADQARQLAERWRETTYTASAQSVPDPIIPAGTSPATQVGLPMHEADPGSATAALMGPSFVGTPLLPFTVPVFKGRDTQEEGRSPAERASGRDAGGETTAQRCDRSRTPSAMRLSQPSESSMPDDRRAGQNAEQPRKARSVQMEGSPRSSSTSTWDSDDPDDGPRSTAGKRERDDDEARDALATAATT